MHFYSVPRKNRGSGGAGAWDESASLALKVTPRQTPGTLLVPFGVYQKELAPRAKPGKTPPDGRTESWLESMSVYNAGQFDIAVIGAGHMGPRRAGRA